MEAFNSIQHRFQTIPWTGCWIWTGWSDENGYGKLSNNLTRMRAHRWTYELFKGKIKKGAVICHTCDITACVNPDHLYEGTQADNVRDRVLRGRGGSHKIAGENSKNSKLKKEDVWEIRSSKQTLSFLAKKFGIGTSQVHRIKTNKSWKGI
jgi:hypothetical protein